MIVRIQLGTGRRIQRKAGKNRHLALAFGALLIPAALMAYVLAFWRLASDIGIVAPSGVTGPFSHWQVSIAAAVFLHATSSVLNRYGRHGEFQLPGALKLRMLPLRPSSNQTEPTQPEARRRAHSG
jgi:hypothetical protein